MAHLLGIDTGGTFTDAVLLETQPDDSRGQVIAKAKSLTTHHDYSHGIAAAAQIVIDNGACDPSGIGMVSLSTTLATNALVEGHGGRVALVAIGFEARDLDNAGLKSALGTDPLILLPGGHDTHGTEVTALDATKLENQLESTAASVAGFAVVGFFAVRNPAHEMAVRDLIFHRTGMAVTCSHELTAQLNGPRRALTTVLNARLVPTITRLIDATKRSLGKLNISAPLMIVRGDGALVRSDFAVRRPVETILSGPAASLVGAHYLTGIDNAFVNDIGGTTSDVAILNDGRPLLDRRGARIGGFRTMVEAVAMHTFGLGGDSEVSLGGAALKPQIMLGPRRLIPVSLQSNSHCAIIHQTLDRQLKKTWSNRSDGQFAIRSGADLVASLSAAESTLYGKISDKPKPLDSLLDGTRQMAVLDRLVECGLVQIAGLTPSDALHALGRQSTWDKEAAIKALRLFGRLRDGSGKVLCDDPTELAAMIVSCMQRRSAEVVLETAFENDGKDGSTLLHHQFVKEVLDHREPGNKAPVPSSAEFSLKLDRPLVGLGAPAHAYHPAAARLLGTNAIVPENADVANAIGAVVGQVMMKAEVMVSQPSEGLFHVTGTDGPFATDRLALEEAESLATSRAKSLALEAGAVEMEISLSHHVKRANVESRDMLVEIRVVATATGRPPIVS